MLIRFFLVRLRQKVKATMMVDSWVFLLQHGNQPIQLQQNINGEGHVDVISIKPKQTNRQDLSSLPYAH